MNETQKNISAFLKAKNIVVTTKYNRRLGKTARIFEDRFTAEGYDSGNIFTQLLQNDVDPPPASVGEIDQLLSIMEVTTKDQLIAIRKQRAVEDRRGDLLKRRESALECFHGDEEHRVVMVDTKYYLKGASGDYSRFTLDQLRPYISKLYAHVPNFDFDQYLHEVNEKYGDNPIRATVYNIAGCASGIQDGALVMRSYRFPEVKPGECPAFHEFIDQCFGPEQKPYILSWWKRSLENLRGDKMLKGHAVYFVGDPNTCKTYTLNLISLSLQDGGPAEARDLILGEAKNGFNADMVQNCVLSCDDKNPPQTLDKTRMAAGIKSLVSASPRRLEQKYSDGFMCLPKWRCVICLNDSTEGLGLLPPLTGGPKDGVFGKVLVFRLNKPHLDPEKYGNLSDPLDDVTSVFIKELPAIRHYLLYEYQIPPELAILDDDPDPRNINRFGIKHYHNPTIDYSDGSNVCSKGLSEYLNTKLKPEGISEIFFSCRDLFRFLSISKDDRYLGISGPRHLVHVLEDLYRNRLVENLTQETLTSRPKLTSVVYTLKVADTGRVCSLDTITDTIEVRIRQHNTTPSDVLRNLQSYKPFNINP